MKPERAPLLYGELRQLVTDVQRKCVVVRNTSITTEFPNIYPVTPYRGFSMAEVLTPARGINPGEAQAVYEQVCWWKLKGLEDKEASAQVKKMLRDSLGYPLAKLIESERNPDRAILLLVWGLGASINLPINLDAVNGNIEVSGHVFGFKDGLLVSTYVKDHKAKRDLAPLLNSPVRRSIRRSAYFALANAATYRDPELNGLLKVSVTALGAQVVDQIAKQQQNLHTGATKKSRALLLKACIKIVGDKGANPLHLLRTKLVPTVIDYRMFKELFGQVRSDTLPGERKRAKLLDALNTLLT